MFDQADSYKEENRLDHVIINRLGIANVGASQSIPHENQTKNSVISPTTTEREREINHQFLTLQEQQTEIQ